MKIMQTVERLSKKRNKIISRVTRYRQRLRFILGTVDLHARAAVLNWIKGSRADEICRVTLENCDPRGGITLTCAGAVSGCLESLDQAVAQPLCAATLSFGCGIDAQEEYQSLREQGLTVLPSSGGPAGWLFCAQNAKIGAISIKRDPKIMHRNRFRRELARRVLTLKRLGADYILIYVDNSVVPTRIEDWQPRLYKQLCKLGADYIIGITPSYLDGGATCKKRDGRVGRMVYSLGTFSAEKNDGAAECAILRLKLRHEDGKLRLVEETFFPFRREADGSHISLLPGHREGALPEDDRKLLARMETAMARIRPADRVLTVGKVMQIIGIPLPPEYACYADHSVGKVCARSFEVEPGDIFFYREAFRDPNDHDVENPTLRLRIAKSAADRGASLLVSFQPLPFKCRSVVCPSAVEAHIAVCAYLRRQFDMKVIGVTGSVGKTSTKDMLAEVMKMRFRTVKSQQNTNVQVKIGMNLQQLDRECEMLIQEIGGGRPGGASRHSRMILPDVTVITNIGDAHIGNFGSREKLMENKLHVIDGMPADGVLYLNADDELLAGLTPPCRTVFCGVHNKNADYYADRITELDDCVTFDIVHGEHRVRARVNVPGEYNVLHAVCCYAIGMQFGMTQEQILQGLLHFHTEGVRQNLINVCGRKLFMDCYNASSESLKSSLDTLLKLQVGETGKRIAVIGDITGLGEMNQEIHEQLAHILAASSVDCIILFGSSTRITYNTLRELGIQAIHTTSRKELNRLLEQKIRTGDAAMFKGSSKMLLEQSVDVVFGTMLTDQRLRDESQSKRLRYGAAEYDLFSGYATAVEYIPRYFGEKRGRIVRRIGGIPVVNLGRAFVGKSLTEVILPPAMRHIGPEAFLNCTDLAQIRLPRKLKFIGESAFKNCRSLQTLEIPEGTLHIGAEAFAGCTGLKRVRIPDSVAQIGPAAFSGCEDCEFICTAGSHAAEYLKKEKACFTVS